MARPPSPERPDDGAIVVYGTDWCSFCHRLRAALTEQDVRFGWIDLDRDETAARYVESVNGGSRVVPTVVFADGSSRTNPSIDEVRAVPAALALA